MYADGHRAWKRGLHRPFPSPTGRAVERGLTTVPLRATGSRPMTRGIRKPAKPDLLVSFTCLAVPCFPSSSPPPCFCLPGRLALNAGPKGLLLLLLLLLLLFRFHLCTRAPHICVLWFRLATDENRTTAKLSEELAFAFRLSMLLSYGYHWSHRCSFLFLASLSSGGELEFRRESSLLSLFSRGGGMMM